MDLFPTTPRVRGEIQTFKMIKGIDNMDCNMYFSIDWFGYKLGNGFKSIGKSFNSYESKNF